jgi:hypothetical protein
MFIRNKYTKWYNSIIENAKKQDRIKYRRTNPNFVYYEKHHIIPKSLGGVEEVLLTAKEHYICHLLLPKMVPNIHKYKMINALIKMTYSKSNKQERYTSRSYNVVRAFIAEKNSAMFKGVPKSKQTLQNMKGHSGIWERTEVYRENASEAQKLRFKNTQGTFTGKIHSEDQKKKWSEERKGKRTKGSKGMKWFTNESEDIFCLPGNEPGNFKLGRAWYRGVNRYELAEKK